MNERPSTSAFTVLAMIVAVMLSLLIPYVIGYFMGSVGTAGAIRLRVYKYEWQEVIYRPAAAAESLFTGRQVVPAYRTPDE